ncbi:hypothetical protein PSCICN_08250 [Pseudomonas cichorii]|uniref:hypothetical protein n=1 Tax=Pseudomonas cichorii TaxID=36746 RepID=UPI0019100DCA|nr:hypothetical protein [Pseudomonas cichorii]GFM80133.1 hypothetical protein PSCICN_08250 [Pseudomonas cichorii]
MSDNKVVINLSVNEAGVLEDSEDKLQQGAYDKLLEKIESQLSSSSSYPYRDIEDVDITYPRAHNAIMIEGSRGSGKTTFLLNSLKKLKKEDLQLSVLKLIDPTLVETKENIVVVILSAIDAVLSQGKSETHELGKAREALAEGLGLLDGIGSSSVYGTEWEDAKWVMSQGLRKAKKGRDFERKLGLYIESALDHLKKRAFILAFDDVDTNFSHGYTILETVRKYLTHPRLVVILSGDVKLYGRLLRKNIYRAFGEQVLNRDPNLIGLSDQSVGGAVLELEEQYLLKIAPPQNRISMVPLGGLKQYLEGGVEVGLGGKSPSVEARSWASKNINELMYEASQGGGVHPFFNLIAMEPLRLVIGYMRALDSPYDTKCSAIFTVFSTRLNAQGVSVDSIFKGDLDHSLRTIFEWMIKQKDAPDLVRFGVSSDVSRAIVVHCFALLLAQKLRGHVGNTLKSLLGLALPLAMMRRPTLLDVEARNSLFGFLWSQSTATAAELAARLGAVDRSHEQISKLKGSSFGSVGLANNVVPKSILHSWYGVEGRLSIRDAKDFARPSDYSSNWLDLLGTNVEKLQMRYGTGWFYIDDLVENRCGKFGEVLRLVVSKRFNERGEVMRSISALSLFGVIADMLAENNIDELNKFSDFSVISPFGKPDFSHGVPDYDLDEGDEFDGGNEFLEGKNESSYNFFMERMKEWHRYARGLEYKISPSMLGRIALRVHDDLLSLDESVTAKWRSGEILHRQIVCVLHGVLSTASLAQGRKETSKVSDQSFVDLLRRFTYEEMPVLAAVLLSCPLIWLFLHPIGMRSKQPLWEAASFALARFATNYHTPSVHVIGFNGESIEVTIGSTHRSSYQIEVVSFYDLLNVVPRYAAK